MTVQKLMVFGVLSLVGVASFDTDVQAGIFRKKQKYNDCNACDSSTSYGTSYGGGAAYSAGAGVPYAMPSPGGNYVRPAGGVVTGDGTRIPGSGSGVIPAGGTFPSSGGVIPASGSYYYNPNTGYYYPSNTTYGSSGMYDNGYSMPYNSTGRSGGRYFRR